MRNNLGRLLTEVDDVYVLETIPQFGKEYDRKRWHKIVSRIAVAAAIFSLVFLAGMTNPVLAQKIPFIGKVFEYLQDKIDFSGLYSHYAMDEGNVANSSGLKVTISESYCDGLNLYISYEIKSEKSYDDYVNKEYMQNQLDYSMRASIYTDDNKWVLDDTGVAGLEGEFVDAYTFVGVETLSLNGKEFPEKFNLSIFIDGIKLLLPSPDFEYTIYGLWKFDIPMESNKEDCYVLNLNLNAEGHSIDKVVVSPIMITVYSSYPDIYRGTVNYDLVAFSDIWDGNAAIQGIYDATSGITRIPRYRVGKRLELYVIDSSTIDVIGAQRYSQEVIRYHECEIRYLWPFAE